MSATRCSSHFAAVTAAAKPIAAQMAGTSVTFVMPFTKAWKAFIGSPAAKQSTRPAIMRTSLVSRRLTSAQTVRTITASASQISQVMIGNLLEG